MKGIFKNKILFWIILGFLLRFILIPITIHPDINGYNFVAYVISQKGQILSFYDYLPNLPADSPLIRLYGVDVFIYPPPLYLLFATFMKILSPLYPWESYQTLLLGFEKVFGDPNLSRLLFLLKGPLLIFDVLGLVLIWKLFDKQKEKFLAVALWLFNSLIFYTSYMMSQFDILIAVSILSAIYFYKTGKNNLGAVSLGLGGLVKMFPLLLLPLFAFVASQKLTGRIKLILIGVFVYILGILPYIPSPGFRTSALLAPQTDKIFFAKIPLTGAEFLPLFLVGLVFLYWLAYYLGNRIALWQWFLAALLFFYSVVHFHPNWFIWLTAPVIILLVSNWSKNILPVGILLLSFLGIIFVSFDTSLNLGFFRMLAPGIMNFSFTDLIARYYQPNILSSIIRGVLAATSAFIVWQFFVKIKS